jgi:holo-[acyl-carrier protein] synthase
MIIGVGLDICSIERVRKAIARQPDRFVQRILSPDELSDVGSRDLALFFAGRFAAKEAFSKVLDGARGVPWHDVHVRSLPNGRPKLELFRKGLELAKSYGADSWHLSITHDAGVAAAVVVLSGAA